MANNAEQSPSAQLQFEGFGQYSTGLDPDVFPAATGTVTEPVTVVLPDDPGFTQELERLDGQGQFSMLSAISRAAQNMEPAKVDRDGQLPASPWPVRTSRENAGDHRSKLKLLTPRQKAAADREAPPHMRPEEWSPYGK